jgi:hypothetical protein
MQRCARERSQHNGGTQELAAAFTVRSVDLAHDVLRPGD